MSLRLFLTAGGWVRATAGGGVFLAAMAVAPTSALETTTLRATYAIALGSLVIGRVQAEGRFTDDGYVAAITGSTSGVSRWVTDASAKLSGTGRIAGGRVLPSSYNLETHERGFATYVDMAMRGGRITSLVAVPKLAAATDRVPVTARHKRNVVDPLGAFIIPQDRPGTPVGRQVCNRTVNVFDGWTRFDVQLFYKETKAVDGSAERYAGRVIVCGARYVPVAGHRSGWGAVNELARNHRLEIWLVPVENMGILVPYRMVIGTKFGDLIIYATRFTADPSKQRAALQ